MCDRYDGSLLVYLQFFFFFFKQKTAYEMRISDWSSDVCSSDLSCSQRPIRQLRSRNCFSTMKGRTPEKKARKANRMKNWRGSNMICRLMPSVRLVESVF